MSAIIQVKDLSKSFIISHEGQERYTALRDVVTNKAKKLFSFSKPAIASEKNTATREEFWALKDVSFEIEKGDRVGIIGRNGAGKSTLLKILSRITEPTSGEIRIKGRVASLLEVGTGFHPELTGRENIFLNGAILGMSRAEIRKKFDEIVAFAEVEKFLDTPVKRYSSGMYVRLAFAVAAHLEPEILVVDEVLAVGDAQFQKKCLGKMEDVSKNEGRTVLFVSHNMATINTLCNTGIFLKEGRIQQHGTIAQVLQAYLNDHSGLRSEKIFEIGIGDEIVKINALRAIDSLYNSKDTFLIDEKIGLEIEYSVYESMHILWHGFNIYNEFGINVFDTHSVTSEYYNEPHPIGKYRAIAWIPANLLSEGTYAIGAAIFNHIRHKIYAQVNNNISFTAIENPDTLTARGNSVENFPGIIRPLLNWETKKI